MARSLSSPGSASVPGAGSACDRSKDMYSKEILNDHLQRAALFKARLGDAHHFEESAYISTKANQNLPFSSTQCNAGIRRECISGSEMNLQESFDLTLSLPTVINLKFPVQPHNMKNLAFHTSLGWKIINLPILTTSHLQFPFKGWENVLFELRSERVQDSVG